MIPHHHKGRCQDDITSVSLFRCLEVPQLGLWKWCAAVLRLSAIEPAHKQSTTRKQKEFRHLWMNAWFVIVWVSSRFEKRRTENRTMERMSASIWHYHAVNVECWLRSNHCCTVQKATQQRRNVNKVVNPQTALPFGISVAGRITERSKLKVVFIPQ
jgi:hypothetical protein